MFVTNRLAMLIALFLISFLLSAETDEQLSKRLSKISSDTSKVSVLLKLATSTLDENTELATKYLDAAFTISLVNESDKHWLAKRDLLRAKLYDKIGLHDSAILFYTYAADLFRELNEVKSEARTINLRGIAYENKVDYRKSFDDYLYALKCYQSINDSAGIANQYINIGLIYQYNEKYDISEKYFIKAIKIARLIGNKSTEMAALNNLAIQYKYDGKQELALSYFKQAYDYDASNGDSLGMSYSLNNIGTVYEELGDYEKAYYYYVKSAAIKSLKQDLVGLGNTYNNISSALIKLGRKVEALTILKKAEALNTAYGYTNNLVQTYFNYHELAKSNNDHKSALAYFIKYKAAEDSVLKSESDEYYANKQHELELQLAQEKINSQKITIEQTARLRKLFLALIILLLIVLATLYVGYLNRERFNKKLREQAIEIENKNSDLIKINADLTLEKNRAELAMKAKSQFLSIMSHEIRTPLNAITSMANLLEEDGLSDIQRKNIRILNSASASLVALVNDILDLSKIESGRLKIESVDFNIWEMLQSITDLYQVNAHQKNIKLICEIDEGIPKFIKGDQLRLNQVITNLISNAIKFTEIGQVVVSVSRLKQMGSDIVLRFQVADTGIGIPADKQAIIFKSFEQADATTTRKFGGTGLGLTISKKIIEMYGSELHVESEVGKGSSFYFDLNMQIGKQSDANSIITDVNTSAILHGLKVLVVEDNPVNVYILNQFFGKRGAVVEVAENGIKAIEKLHSYTPEVILMDIHMPEMDGYEASKIITQSHSEIPILAVTASDHLSEQEQQQLRNSGIRDVVVKPFNPNDLIDKITKVRAR